MLLTSGVVIAAAAATAGCGSDAASGKPDATDPATISTTDIPVGGGLVLSGKQVVITQPTAGDFKAFSAVCTHAGCLVSSVADGKITCPCHNGVFSAVDGSVQDGPPPSALAPVAITILGTTITLS